MVETILFTLFIVLIFVAVISALKSIPTYKYELLGTFIQNYSYIYGIKMIVVTEQIWLLYLRIKKINLVNMKEV